MFTPPFMMWHTSLNRGFRTRVMNVDFVPEIDQTPLVSRAKYKSGTTEEILGARVMLSRKWLLTTC
jgi:hypothetical protein